MSETTMAAMPTKSVAPSGTASTTSDTLTSAARAPTSSHTVTPNWITSTTTSTALALKDNNNNFDHNDTQTTTTTTCAAQGRNDTVTREDPPQPRLNMITDSDPPTFGRPRVQEASSSRLPVTHSTTDEETLTFNSYRDVSGCNNKLRSKDESYRTVNANSNGTKNSPASLPRVRTTMGASASSTSRPVPTRGTAVSDADGSGVDGGYGSRERRFRRRRTLRPSSNPCVWLLVLQLLSLVCVGQSSATWWFISQLPIHASGTGVLCDNIPGLVGRQKRLCRHHPDVMVSLAEGARLGVRECQYQFQSQRWNCTTLTRDFSVFGKIMLKGSREAAFVYAISAAGVVHAITRACSKGQLHYCACDPTKRGTGRDKRGSFDWGGCSDNVRYGSKFSRMFIDAKERKVRDPRALMNLHNNRAGRRAVKKFRKLECKCHGVSGSCTIRSCWLAMQEFRRVGNHLKTKHNGATQVMINQEGSGLIVANKNHKRPTRSDLVYFEKSPDYCVKDPDLGSLGTAGRTCNKTSLGTDGCDIMCCGRGYDTKTVRKVDKCECKFHWCCFVVCKECRRWVDVHTCKGPPEEELYKAQQLIGSNGSRGKHRGGSSSSSSSSGRARVDVEGNTYNGRRPKRERLS